MVVAVVAVVVVVVGAVVVAATAARAQRVIWSVGLISYRSLPVDEAADITAKLDDVLHSDITITTHVENYVPQLQRQLRKSCAARDPTPRNPKSSMGYRPSIKSSSRVTSCSRPASASCSKSGSVKTIRLSTSLGNLDILRDQERHVKIYQDVLLLDAQPLRTAQHEDPTRHCETQTLSQTLNPMFFHQYSTPIILSLCYQYTRIVYL